MRTARPHPAHRLALPPSGFASRACLVGKALDGVTSKRKDKPEPTAAEKVAEELVHRVREQGLSLTGPDGLLKQLTKTMLETALNQEMTEHVGYEKHGPVEGSLAEPLDPDDKHEFVGRIDKECDQSSSCRPKCSVRSGAAGPEGSS